VGIGALNRESPRGAYPLAMLHRIARRIAAGTALALSLVATASAGPEEAPGRARIVSHKLTVRLDPKTHRLVGKDVIEFDVSKGRSTGGLFIPKVLASSVPLSSNEAGVHAATLPEGTTTLEVTYEATIFDAVRKSDAAAFVVGDDTKGVISEDGVYLSARSGWYPTTGEDGLARFDVTSYVPEPFLVVTQGGVAERSSVAAPAGFDAGTEVAPAAGAPPAEAGVRYAVAKAHARMPTDGCDLVAGPYRTTTRTVEGIEIATWFFEKHEGAQALWLDSMDAIVKRYEPILGSYPHPKFDIVENFFSSGYGMPSFTLLGSETIAYVTEGAKRSGGKIPPGYLDHEYVHGWFGNGLFVDPKDGNWCEALTTYFSNYLAKELESPEAAREHRRGILEHFAIRVKGEKDYPIRAFRTKTEEVDNDVGYGKGAMLFHMLRKRLGDENFFAAVKGLAESRIGTYVNWDDWLATLDGAWAKPFLERKGLPAVRLASATAWRAGIQPSAPEVRAEVVVDQPRGEAPWPDFDLPISIDGKLAGSVRVQGRSGVFRAAPEHARGGVIELDPDYDGLRRIAEEDLPPCLNRTLEGGETYLVAPDAPQAIASLAQALVTSKGVKRASPIPDAATALVLLNVVTPDKSWALEGLASADGNGLTLKGTRYEGAGHALLLSRADKGSRVTYYVACSEAAAARATRVPFYGWDEYVVFRDGRPVARGRLDPTPKATRGKVVVNEDVAAEVHLDVRVLGGDAFEGRAPGTKSHAALEGFLRKGGAEVPLAPGGIFEFPLGVADLVSSRDLVLTTDAGTETLKDAFRPLFHSPEREAGTPLPFAEGSGAVPLPGRLPDTSPAGLARFQEQIAAGTAPAILIIPSVPTRRGLAPLLDAPNALTPESIADLAKPGPDGKPRPRPPPAQWIGARRVRAFPGAKPLRVPVLILEDAAIERLERPPAVRSIDFAVKFSPERATWAAGKGGRNVVLGKIPKHLEGPRPPVVVVCAHYDSFGMQNGILWRGADDNASGVAAVRFATREWAAFGAPETKAGLILVYFDGEEWGLQGSRALVPALTKAYDVKAVVNVDAVGRVRDDTVYVLGLSKHPELAKKAGEALKDQGLSVGRDIDAFGYEEGSDHWPFHQAGIPALTLWASDYGTMNTASDDPDKVDPVGVARISSAVRALLLRLTRE
jgi:aminopeptidase N